MMDSTEAYFGGAEIETARKTMHSDNAHIRDQRIDDAGAGAKVKERFLNSFKLWSVRSATSD
jgi:hypothetical protein